MIDQRRPAARRRPTIARLAVADELSIDPHGFAMRTRYVVVAPGETVSIVVDAAGDWR